MKSALDLVTEGRLYDLGRVLDEHPPVFHGRQLEESARRQNGGR